MGLPVSLLLIAGGAILTFAVNRSPHGLNIHVVGVVLMVVGALGFLLTLMWWDRWGWGASRRGYYADAPPAGPAGYRYPSRGRTVVEEDVPAGPADLPPPPPLPPDAPPPPP